MKAVIDRLEDVGEALRGEYEPHEGKFRLKLEGDPVGFAPAAKVAEFRATNVQLLQALGARTPEEGLQKAGLFAGLTPEKLEAMKDLDPVAAKAAMARLAALEAKGVSKADDVKAMLDAALAPVNAKLEAAEKREREAQARADEAVFAQAVSDRFSKARGRAGAIGFIVDQAKRAGFKVEGGQIVPPSGKFDATGAALSLDSWMTGAVKEFDFAFEPSQGAGAGNGAAGSPDATSRPGVKQIVMAPDAVVDASRFKYVPNKGLTDLDGNVVEIVNPAA